MIALQIGLLVFFLFCSGFFSSSEVALFSLSSIKVKTFKNDPDKRKRLVGKLLSSPRDLLVTILMFNIIVNIMIQNVTSNIFGDFSGWAFNVGVPLALTLVFGEVLPKSVGLANNLAISYRVAPFLDFSQRLFFPLRRALITITSVVSRVLFFFLKKEEEISADEMQHALLTSREYGILNEDEAELIRGYLKLQDSQVNQLKRPREEMLFFDIEDPISKLIHLFVDQKCSRIPVCSKNQDNMLGIISGQSFFLQRDKLLTSRDVISFLSKPFFVPESMSAEILLKQMYQKQESIALVVDEYGSISGLIALEDLVETVVGEISDARDEKSRFTQSGQDVLIASGKMELSDFETLFDVILPSENNRVTLGGWLTEQIGDIPKTGTKFSAHGFLFHILAADQKRIRRVYIRRLKSPGAKKKESDG